MALNELFLKSILKEKDIELADSSITEAIVLASKYSPPSLEMKVEDNDCILWYTIPYDAAKEKIETQEEAFNLRIHGWELSEDEKNIIKII